jgi:hypothetical protein
MDWTKENGESYAELDELYGALGQFRRYMGHVTKNVVESMILQNI